jgi:hypothetical protein
MHLDKSVDNVERYKVVKKTAKRMVGEVRDRMYNGLHQMTSTDNSCVRFKNLRLKMH